MRGRRMGWIRGRGDRSEEWEEEEREEEQKGRGEGRRDYGSDERIGMIEYK